MVPWQMKRLLSYDFDSFGESRSDPELQVLAEEEQGKRAGSHFYTALNPFPRPQHGAMIQFQDKPWPPEILSMIFSPPRLCTTTVYIKLHRSVGHFTAASQHSSKPIHASTDPPPITACSGVEIMVDNRNDLVELCRFFI